MSAEKTLLEVVREGDKAKVAWLLQEDVSLDEKFTALHFAVQKGSVEIIGVFKQDIPFLFEVKNQKGQTVLHWAVQANNHHSIRYLCSMPEVEKNPYDNEEKTPLFYAVEQKNVELIDLLFTCGVPNEVGRQNGKIVDIGQMTAFFGYRNILTHVLNKKWVTHDSEATHYCTPLHAAAYAGHSDIIRFLLKRSADIHATTSSGWNALHVAAEGCRVDAVNLLLKKGADANAKTQDGNTPLKIAINNGYWELIPLFNLKRQIKLTNEDIIELDKNFVPPTSPSVFDFSNHDFDHHISDKFINLFKKSSPHVTSVNLSNNIKMGNGQLLPTFYSGVQKIFYTTFQTTSITTFDLSRCNLNKHDIKSVQWALEHSPNLKTVYVWEDSLKIFANIFESNVWKVQGKKKGGLIVIKPPLKRTKKQISTYSRPYTTTHVKCIFGDKEPYSFIGDGNDTFREIFSYLDRVSLKLAAFVNHAWYTMAQLIDPTMQLQNWLVKNIALPLFNSIFIYYVGYWHDQHISHNQTIGIYLKHLKTLLLTNKQFYIVFWEGICGGLRENKITGIQLKLSNCFLDNDRLKMGFDRLFLSPKASEGLEQLKSLTHLDLSYNHIRHWGISELCNWLKNTLQLTYLDLSGNPLDDYVPAPSGAMRLSEALPSLQKLQTLLLAKCRLWPSHLQLLADAIHTHPALTQVNFNANEVKNDSAMLLAKTLLKPSSHLRILHLADNIIENKGAIQLFNSLKHCTTLIELDLTDNKNVSEDVMGPIRWKLRENGAKLSHQLPNPLKQGFIQETQRRLLLWETVGYAWHRYAEAVDEDKISQEQKAVLLKDYQTMANRLVDQLAPGKCKVAWSKKIPESPAPYTYYLIKEAATKDWQVFYSEKSSSPSYKDISSHVKGLKEVLSHFSIESMENLVSPPSVVEHVIDAYHQNQFARSENLKKFYRSLSQALEKLFITFSAVGTQLLDTNVTKPIGYVGKGASAIGDALCGTESSINLIDIPLHVTGKALSFIGWLLTVVDKLQQGNDLRQFLKIGIHEEFNALAQQLALHLTLLYQPQLFALSPIKPEETLEILSQRSFSEKKFFEMASEAVHSHPKSPLEAFSEFIVSKIGLRCIMGEAVQGVWTFTNAIAKLLNLATTAQACKVTKKKEELMAWLNIHSVFREEITEYYPVAEKMPWKLSKLCSQTAMFDYAKGHYYTRVSTHQKTDIEKLSYVYVRQVAEAKDLQPALLESKQIVLFPSFPALLQTFLGENVLQSGLALTSAYDPKMMDYFMAQVENHAQCIRVTLSLAGNKNPWKIFQIAMQQLALLSHELDYPAVFISPIPEEENYYLCGFIYNKELLIINPLKETKFPITFNYLLTELQEREGIHWFGFTNAWLHKDGVYDKITATSSIPIVLELMQHFLTSYTLEAFREIWIKFKKNAKKLTPYLRGYEVDLSKSLTPSPRFLQLDQEKDEFDYQQTMIELRQSHYEWLQQWVFEEGRSPQDLEKLEKSAAQTVFDQLMAGRNLKEVLQLDCGVTLKKELENVSFPKLVTQVKSLGERIVSLEDKSGQFDSDISDMKNQIQKIETTLTTGKLPPELQSQLQRQVNELSQQVGGLETRINGKISELKTQMDEKDERIEKQDEEIRGLNNRVGKLEEKIRELTETNKATSTNESNHGATQANPARGSYGSLWSQSSSQPTHSDNTQRSDPNVQSSSSSSPLPK